jgi:uncharacterized protein YkuJ
MLLQTERRIRLHPVPAKNIIERRVFNLSSFCFLVGSSLWFRSEEKSAFHSKQNIVHSESMVQQISISNGNFSIAISRKEFDSLNSTDLRKVQLVVDVVVFGQMSYNIKRRKEFNRKGENICNLKHIDRHERIELEHFLS